jgi:threonine dehydrogenase-like Zn-dependent dehydrogenase
MTGGRGPDACVDAVGMEGHGMTIGALYDRAKQALMLETDRANTLRQAILACRKGGVVSVPGVYGGLIDKFPIGAVFAKGLTLRAGQTHVHRYMKPLLKRIVDGEIDPSMIITHRMSLDDAERGYRMFQNKEDQCIKIVMKP